MSHATPIHLNTDELKSAWRRSGLMHVMSFEAALAAPLALWALKKSALAARRRQAQPMHPALARHF